MQVENTQDIGLVIKKLREKSGMSQRQLGDRTGFTDQAIYYWETGRRNIGFDNAQRVLSALGYRIEIVEDTNEG